MIDNIQKQITTTASGMKVCAISYPSIKSVTIRATVYVGSIYETEENNGISHFLEHMLFRGNRRLGDASQMSLKIEELGGEINAATSFDITEYWLDFHIDYLKTGITRFCDFLRFPLFEDIDLEKSIIMEEIRSDYNESHHLIDIDTISALRQWPDHPMGLPVIGREESVGRITLDALEDWYKTFYQPGNMVISIVGDFQANLVMEDVTSSFQEYSWSARKKYAQLSSAEISRNHLHLVHDKDNQFRIDWAFNSFLLSPRQRIIYQLLRRVLDDGASSRLQKFIREDKGLVYEVSADTFFYNSGVTFSINSLVSRGRLYELIDVLVSLVENLLQNGVTEKEFELARRRYLISLDCNGDTPHGILFETVAPMIYPHSLPIPELVDMLKTITLGELNETVQHVFKTGNSCFVMVGPCDETIEAAISKRLTPWID